MGSRLPTYPHTAVCMAKSPTALRLPLPYAWAPLWLSRQGN